MPSAPPSETSTRRTVNRRTVVPPAATAAPKERPAARVRGSKLARARAQAKKVLSTVSLAAALVASLFGGREAHRWLVTTPRFGARELRVDGAVHTSRDEVLRAAGVTPGRNVLSIDAERAARAVERLPWVSRARVERRLPDVVHVTVQERQPVAVLSAGGLYLVGEDGDAFKRLAAGDPTDLPVITGIDRELFTRDPAAARAATLDALAVLADVAATSLGANRAVDEVHRDATGELSVILDGTYVWLGRGAYRAKLTRLRIVQNELRRRGLRAAEVHLEGERYPERTTVRPRGTGDAQPSSSTRTAAARSSVVPSPS